MFTERMTRIVIVPILFMAMGVPVSASAQTRRAVPSQSAVNAGGRIRSADGAFVLDTIHQATVQVALARLAMSETSESDTRNVALEAEELWTNVDNRLHAIAQALGIPTPLDRDARERTELSRLQNLKAHDFDSTYERLVTRGCNALLERMDRMDPRIDSRLLFFVDDMLPRFGQLQIGLRNRYAYLAAQPRLPYP